MSNDLGDGRTPTFQQRSVANDASRLESDPDARTPPGRASRTMLYVPFAILALFAVVWSAYWVIASRRVNEGIDAWFTREASIGRNWTCENRNLGGYPFRFELDCKGVALETQAPSVPLALAGGALRLVAQAHKPQHVIAELDGPVMILPKDGTPPFELSWRRLRSSTQLTSGRLERFSLTVEQPALRQGSGTDAPKMRADRLEWHLRKAGGDKASAQTPDGAFEIVGQLAKAVLPALDGPSGNTEPGDFELQARVTQANEIVARPVLEEIERWRQGGGTVNIGLLKLAKGSVSLNGKGDLALDDLHRISGRLETSITGLDRLIGAFTGPAGSLFTQRAPPAGEAARPVQLTLRAENGRLFVGPLRLGVLPPLY